MFSDEHYMGRAVELARKGLGRTSPNPCVGAVIVKNGKIIGEGYHKKAGTPHAEVNAIASCEECIAGATVYVTLEPCSHHGRTPPCCEALARENVSRVVVGMTDPNPLVNGNGVRFLEERGVDVVTGVLEQECRELNYPFIKFVTRKLPWVIMKAGVSLDGRLNYQRNMSGWITGARSREEVHKLRDQVDAILVGKNTVEIDNPSLTTRLDERDSQDPVRIILDSNLAVSSKTKVCNVKSSSPTWIFTAQNLAEDVPQRFKDKNVQIFQVSRNRESPGLNLREILARLAELNITSLLVEGGAAVHGSFLKERLYDYACLFYGARFAGSMGVPLVDKLSITGRETSPQLENPVVTPLGNDFMVTGKIRYGNNNDE